jgi:hypothetical protein
MSRKARFKPTLADFADRPPEPDANEPRTVVVIEARPGGEFVTVEMMTCSSYAAARSAADRAQELADADCLPQRAYVLDKAGIPIFTAGMSAVGREQAWDQRQSIANCNRR